MELRRYWEIIRRRWWIVLGLPLLVGLFSLLTYEPSTPLHAYDLQYSVSFTPAYGEVMNEDPTLDAVQASEYIADDLTELLQGTTFFDYVASYLPDTFFAGQNVSAALARGAVLQDLITLERVEKTHRLLDLTFAMEGEQEAEQLVTAVKQAISNDVTPWLREIWAVSPILMELVNETGPYEMREGLGPLVEFLLRIVIALFAALALALLLEYLDSTIRNRTEAESIAGPVLAEIPGE